MRLSTALDRDETRAVKVIHAALSAGARLLDTADVYCHGESDLGHNERLIATALKTWHGDRSSIEVATKGGLRRPGGRWVPDGRAKHLVAACEASRRALDFDQIDLYQLHAVDPATPLETSVRALAELQARGIIRRIGLCNVTVGQIEAARAVAEIASVQVGLGPWDETAFRNGVAEYCRDHGIRLIAYRPLGGDRAGRLARDPALAEIAARHEATPQEVALAWLLDLHSRVVPIPGATRVSSAASLGRAARIRLAEPDRAELDRRFPAGRLLRLPRSARRPPAPADGEVVLVMGMPGAGKSRVARELEARGYDRLNRDLHGGSLADLVPELATGLAAGRRRWVLDNTYPTRSSRNQVIECAWQAGVPVRCIWLRTTIADAQINAVLRLIDAHGRLPTPAELKARSRGDHRYFGPDAQYRWERAYEPPVLDEGFIAVDERLFEREKTRDAGGRAIILEYDRVLCSSAGGARAVLDPEDIVIEPSRRETLARYHARGWCLFAHVWRPQVADGSLRVESIDRGAARTRELLGLPIEIGYCPHPAGPVGCWCRKPLPGLALEFATRHRVALEHSIVVGRGPADRTLAERLHASYRDAEEFFGSVTG